MASVTYKGPTKREDGTTRYVIGGVRFTRDLAVDVEDKAILDKINAGITGHKFEVSASKTAAGSQKPKEN
jgi:hypothetical protein